MNRNLLLKSCLAFIIVTPFTGFGQTGPGGVGQKNLQGMLVLWLKSDESINLIETNKVAQWNDLSGYGNNAVSLSDSRPVYLQNVINGLPSVKFDGFNDRLTIAGNTSLQPDNVTIYAVVRRNGLTGWGDVISRPFSTGWASPYTSYAINSCNTHDGVNSVRKPFSQVAVGNNQICNWNPAHDVVPDNQTFIHALAYNYHGLGLGSFINNGLQAGYLAIIPATGPLDYNGIMLDVSIGNRSNYSLGPNGDHFLNGEIAEIAMYNQDITEVDHIILANYLAAKYNVTIGWDQYTEQAGFTTDVIGIGKEISIDPDHSISQGGNLTLTSSGFTACPSYIFAGHNNGSMTGTPVSQPTGYNNRLNRVWYLEYRGAKPSMVSLSFTLPVTPSYTLTHYGLLYSPSSGFSNPTQVMLASSINTTERQVSFIVPAASLLNGFYTLGSKVNLWHGVTTDWNNVSNWDGAIPGNTSSVVISGNCSNYPVLVQDASCYSLYIQTGGSLNIGNQTIEIYKDYVFGGNQLNSSSGGTFKFKGIQDADIWAGSSVLQHVVSEKIGGQLKIFQPITINGNFNIVSGSLYALSTQWYLAGDLNIASGVSTLTLGLKINCIGNGNQNLTCNLFLDQLNINNPANSTDISNATLTVGETNILSGKLITGANLLQNINIQPSGHIELNGNLTVSKSFVNYEGLFTPNAHKVTFSQNQVQNIKTGGVSLYDLEVNKTGGSLNLLDNLDVDNDLTITQGLLNAGSGDISVGGDWTDNGNFSHNSRLITFNGTSTQLIQGTSYTVFGSLTVAENATIEIVSGKEVTVSGNLILNADSKSLGKINNVQNLKH